jgi:hypothetical protein
MLPKLQSALLGLACVSIAPCAAADPPPIFVGGQFIRQHAVEDAHGHLLVPVRGIFEAFGASVAYTPPRIVVVRKNGVVLAGLVVGRYSAIVGNRPRYLDAAPIRRAGRVYVPLRSIAEIAGASVVYSRNPRLVDIRVPNNELAAHPGRGIPDLPPEPAVPLWAGILVGAVVLVFLIEFGRRLCAVVPRKPPRTGLHERPALSGSRAGARALPPYRRP